MTDAAPTSETKEEKELTPEEEDKKDLYDAIKELKPEEVNDNIRAKLLAVADVHLEYKKIENDQYGKEYDALQDKYDKQYQEIYDKIDQIVKSKDKIEVTPEEMEKYGITDDGENHEIEDYWQKVILNSRYFTINEKDKAIIKYIEKVNMVKFPQNVNNFRVDFIFKPNEFFTPEVLSKTYEYDKDGVLKKQLEPLLNGKVQKRIPQSKKLEKSIKKEENFSMKKKRKKSIHFSHFLVKLKI